MLQRYVKFPKTAVAAAALLSYCVFPFNVKRMNSRLPVKTNNLQQTSLFFPLHRGDRRDDRRDRPY